MPDAITASTQQTDAGTSTAATTDATTRAATTTAAAATGTTQATTTQATGTTQAAAVTTTDTAKTAWGDDWRENYSQTDDKKLNVLKRYAGVREVLDAHFALKQRVDSGELKADKPLAANATPEQITAWRAERGIPDKPEAYLEKLPAEIKLDGIDKTAVDSFAKVMHEANVPPSVVHKALAWQAQRQTELVDARATADKELQTATEDALRSEWGNDYRANINNVHALLDTAPAEVAENWLNARLPDGTPLVGKAETVRWLAQIAKDINPIATIVPGGAGNTTLANVDTRITEIEKMMRTDRAGYNRDDKVQGEYRNLLSARERMNRKTA